jgi:hypothetical protein
MRQQNAIFWLRISYWIGAIIDGLVAIPMLFPRLTRLGFGFDVIPNPPFRYAMGMGAALMLGWTVLLLWADQDPLARKGVLLITIFPVILGIAGTIYYGVYAGLTPLGRVIPTWMLQILLISLFSGSYLNAVRYERNERSTKIPD